MLLCDSTNAESAGHAPSETNVGSVLRSIFAECKGRRVITASFASHLHRIQQIADAAIESGRVVATLGMSIRKNVQLGIDLGIIHIPASKLVDIEDIDRLAPGEVCVISTGSQGEPMSALALLARGENKFVKLSDHDTVILSSHAIPGNESNVNRVLDGLLRAGAQVVHSGIRDVHATGHAQADDIKTYLSIAQPEWFVPVHGEYRHLVANAELGDAMGVPADHVLVCADGDVLAHRATTGSSVAGRVPAGYLYVDGIVGDVGMGVLRDRRILAAEGVVVVVVTVDVETGKVLTGPEIITRGWVYAPEAEDAARRGVRHDRRHDRGVARQRGARRRGARAGRAAQRRALRQRAHAAAADDRARRDGSVTPGRARVVFTVLARPTSGPSALDPTGEAERSAERSGDDGVQQDRRGGVEDGERSHSTEVHATEAVEEAVDRHRRRLLGGVGEQDVPHEEVAPVGDEREDEDHHDAGPDQGHHHPV